MRLERAKRFEKWLMSERCLLVGKQHAKKVDGVTKFFRLYTQSMTALIVEAFPVSPASLHISATCVECYHREGSEFVIDKVI